MGSENERTQALYSNFSGQDLPPQPPVTHQAEPWVFERCRLVVLEKEMAHPGECVPLHEGNGNQPPPLRDHRGEQQRDGNARPGEMQSPADRIGMLAKVKRVEIAESTKCLPVHWRKYSGGWLERQAAA